jgi:hypothetical protein
MISPCGLNTHNKVTLLLLSENNRNIFRKEEGFPPKRGNSQYQAPQGFLDTGHQTNTERTNKFATHQFATCCDTHEGINYGSATEKPTVYTRITLSDIRSEIRYFFGEFTSPQYKKFHEVDADFLVSFCK